MKIVLSIGVTLFLVACGEESSNEVQKTEVKEIVKKEVIVQKVVEKESLPIKVTRAVADTKVVQVADGATIYKLCGSCHGVDGSKAALGKSQIIKAWSADKVEKALNGYIDGSYGGVMKGLMKGQASKLNAQEIKAVSKYISTL